MADVQDVAFWGWGVHGLGRIINILDRGAADQVQISEHFKLELAQQALKLLVVCERLGIEPPGMDKPAGAPTGVEYSEGNQPAGATDGGAGREGAGDDYLMVAELREEIAELREQVSALAERVKAIADQSAGYSPPVGDSPAIEDAADGP
jgi:uncharacterized small protein (DUF1192 family)